MTTTPTQHRTSGARKALAIVFANLALIAVLCFALEGLSSTILVARRVFFSESHVVRRHTQYDEEVGWINQANAYIQDCFGPGLYFKSNSRSFRNDRDFPQAAPRDK